MDTPLGENDMNTKQAQQQGALAFKDGKGRAPALNLTFLASASESGDLLGLMDAYTHGWTIAMLANDVPDKSMPSVRELEEIESS
jgi:hypothetical protein